jgi:hypothetical protein
VLGKTKTITAQVLESIQRHPACEFAQLVADCQEFTWNQLFYEVDRLSRLGQLGLTPADHGQYFLVLPEKEEHNQTPHVAGQPAAGTIPIPTSFEEPED